MATSTQIQVIDGDGHIIENRERLSELLEEPYRKFRSVNIESSTLVPLDGIDRNLGQRAPSSYVHQGGKVFACEANERQLPHALDVIGDDTMMYASDYPHWDCNYPGSLHRMQSRTDLTDRQRKGLLHGAAARFYRLRS